MDKSTVIHICQVAAALGILNVWLVRSGMATAYRGGEAKSLKEEFRAYGLPPWSLVVIGSLKLLSAALLVAGIWLPVVTLPAAAALGLLMAGAVGMHVKVGDPARKALPALAMLALCLIIALGS